MSKGTIKCFDPLCEKHNKSVDWNKQALDNEKVIQDLAQQLADEQEKLKGELANGNTLFQKVITLEKQLADEREKFDVLQRQAEELHGRAQRAEDQLAAKDELHAAALQVLERHHQNQLAAERSLKELSVSAGQAMERRAEQLREQLAAKTKVTLLERDEAYLDQVDENKRLTTELKRERSDLKWMDYFNDLRRGIGKALGCSDDPNEIIKKCEQLAAAVEALRRINELLDEYGESGKPAIDTLNKIEAICYPALEAATKSAEEK